MVLCQIVSEKCWGRWCQLEAVWMRYHKHPRCHESGHRSNPPTKGESKRIMGTVMIRISHPCEFTSPIQLSVAALERGWKSFDSVDLLLQGYDSADLLLQGHEFQSTDGVEVAGVPGDQRSVVGAGRRGDPEIVLSDLLINPGSAFL